MAATPTVSVRLPAAQAAALDRLRKRLTRQRTVGREVTRSDVVRALLDKYLSRFEAEVSGS